jgi:hypothetical protein
MPYYYGNQYYPYYQRQDTYQPIRQGLQGKTVDNMDVVKAIDIPLDGSISYYPLADGTAILSKQLQQDGTSRIVVYRPEEQKQIKYVTEKDLNAIKEELNTLKEQLKREKVEHEPNTSDTKLYE